MERDTIAAISTPFGEGGIGVLRVSGENAIAIVDNIYKGKERLIDAPTHTVHYGYIVDNKTKGKKEKIDEVLVTVMRAPRTFTAEDVVEISCHGSMVLVEGILETVLHAGARLAEPGEFTKRAFLNGRIDLSQAEAVIDLIRSKTRKTASLALKQVEGSLSARIQKLREEIVGTLAHLAVDVDYPEYDTQDITSEEILSSCNRVLQELYSLLLSARQGKIYREGLRTAIIGRPNVGKSSLLNALTQENKAIVTDIPGTTRDTIEEYVNVRGIPLRLMDTAGIRETEDVVEKMGVTRSYEALGEADLILLVLNYGEPLGIEDRALLKRSSESGREVIIIVNKTDVPPRLNVSEVKELANTMPLVQVSIKEDRGLSEIEEAIVSVVSKGEIEGSDATYVGNARHVHLLTQAQNSVKEVICAVECGVPLDIAEIDLKNAWEYLGEIIGEAVTEDLIDQIFSQFCLGK